MATGGDPVAALQDESTCAICLDYFQDPLMITDCGHNFCRACITRFCGGGPDRGVSCCPECRKPFSRGNLRANRHLGNLAELIQRFPSQWPSEAEGAQKVCWKHKEALKLFCREDRVFICVLCKESPDHKTHAALPIAQAVQEYQDQIQNHLTLLMKKRDEIRKTRLSNKKVIQDVMKGIIDIREWKERAFPEKKVHTLSALLRDAEEKTLQMADENASDALEHSAHLTKLIMEMEAKCRQPPFEFLQDIGAFLSKCEIEMARTPKAELGMLANSVLQNLLILRKMDLLAGGNLTRDFSKPRASGTSLLLAQQPANQQRGSPACLPASQRAHSHTFLPAHPGQQPGGAETGTWEPVTVLSCRENNLLNIITLWSRRFQSCHVISPEKPLILAPDTEPLTFDSRTAHPFLVVSRSGKSARWGGLIREDLCPGTKRFVCSRCLLSKQGFTSGTHSWVIEVVKEGPWAIGVALESVPRKRSVNLNPREGIWAMAFCGSKYVVHTPRTTPLILSSLPRVIQVYLNYEKGEIVFLDFYSKTLLCAFLYVSLSGQKVHAFFRVGGPSAHLRLCCPGYLARLRFP